RAAVSPRKQLRLQTLRRHGMGRYQQVPPGTGGTAVWWHGAWVFPHSLGRGATRHGGRTSLAHAGPRPPGPRNPRDPRANREAVNWKPNDSDTRGGRLMHRSRLVLLAILIGVPVLALIGVGWYEANQLHWTVWLSALTSACIALALLVAWIWQ